ncbi:MAG: hypothetical protein ACE5IP_02560 [Terriglobia bacterium]
MRRLGKVLLTLLTALLVLAALLAWRIHTWGRPVPVVYQRIAVTPADAESGRSYTYLRLGAAPGEPKRFVTLDTDGDGTIDLVLNAGSAAASFPRPQADDPETRWLVICLDGVPYEVLLSLWEEGYFREFLRPVPVISTFPSDSETALTDIFHTGPVPGYEHRTFDRNQNRLTGGAFITLSEENIPYLALLDYDMGGLFKGLAYALPRKSYRADLGRLRQRFLASHENIYLAHIASVDSLYHILRPQEMLPLLQEVDSLLRELYFDAQGKLRITVFSDHGNSLVASGPVPLAEVLAANGWRLRASLREPRDVVVPAYGLVGFLAAYCAPEERAVLASILAQIEGVDLAVYREANGVVLESARGRARLLWREEGAAFKYQPLSGDPLQLLPLQAKLRQEEKVDGQGWVADADLLRTTRNHVYPDPGFRLRAWATNHVRNRADVLVSLQPGYYYGSSIFQGIVHIYSTHGGLDRAQTLGFIMSTDGPLRGAVRSRDLLPKNLAEDKLLRGAPEKKKPENRN